ncbi:PKP1 protein, partial [Polypterus senegalus]
RLGGIQKLISLIKSRNPKVQQAVAGALRNAAFKNDLNKREIFNNYGIDEALRVLKNQESSETQKQLTGLLWNLSSHDDLKSRMINVVLPSLTENVVLPFVGCPEERIPANNKMDPEIFFNATGCLRNLSCSSEKERNAMRECRGLIDSLMNYLQGCVDANRPDDKSVENCACILHNLSYQLNSEVPSKLETMEYSRPRNSSSRKSSSSVGCFSPRSGKISEEVSDVMSDSLVRKVKGLPEFSRLLRSSNKNIQKAAVSVLGNIARTPSVQKTMYLILQETDHTSTEQTGHGDEEEQIEDEETRLFFYHKKLKKSTHSSPAAQLNQYLENCDGQNCLLFWGMNKEKMPSLFQIAMRVLAVPVSSAPVERVFSHGGIIMRPHRSQLSSNVSANLIFCKCNTF